MIVLFEPDENIEKFGVDRRENLRHIVECLRVADAGHHVLALCVHEEVAIGTVVAGGCVAGEPHTGARCVVAIAEHHRLDIHRGSKVVRDLLPHPVRHSSRSVPRTEHRLDRAVQLLARILRERHARVAFDRTQVLCGQLLQRCCIEVSII